MVFEKPEGRKDVEALRVLFIELDKHRTRDGWFYGDIDRRDNERFYVLIERADRHITCLEKSFRSFYTGDKRDDISGVLDCLAEAEKIVVKYKVQEAVA